MLADTLLQMHAKPCQTAMIFRNQSSVFMDINPHTKKLTIYFTIHSSHITKILPIYYFEVL